MSFVTFVRSLALVIISGALVWGSPFVRADDWPTFRGARHTGVSNEKNLLKSWPEGGPPLVWESTGAGRGYASIAVAGDKLFTLGDALSTKRDDEDEYLTAFDRKTGKQLWATRTGPPWKEMNPDWHNSRSTPTVAGDMVYAITPKGVLVACKTADGQEVWRKNLVDDLGGKKSDPWGYSESVLIDGDNLICTPGGEKATMVALNKKTGDVVWTAVRPEDIGAGHASILVSEIGGTKVYVQTTGSGALGVSAKDGKLLWSYPMTKTTAVIPTAIVRGDLVFFPVGYGVGSALLQQIPEANGEVSIKEIYKFNPKLANKHGGVVLIGDYIYGDSDDRGNPFCADLMTGDVKWKGRGPGKGSIAVIADGDMLYMEFQSGELALVKADPSEYTVVSEFKIPAASPRPSWSHPSIADGKLYLRAQDQLFCYDISAHKDGTAAAPTSAKPAAAPAKIASGEMFANGNFANGNVNWSIDQGNGAAAKVTNVKEGPNGASALRMEVETIAAEAWRLQVYQGGMHIEKGKPYTMTYWAKSNRDGAIKVICMQNHEPWEHSTQQEESLSKEWKQMQFKFVGPWDDKDARITFTDLGTDAGRVYWFANCSLTQN